jgi:hypothetical protein
MNFGLQCACLLWLMCCCCGTPSAKNAARYTEEHMPGRRHAISRIVWCTKQQSHAVERKQGSRQLSRKALPQLQRGDETPLPPFSAHQHHIPSSGHRPTTLHTALSSLLALLPSHRTHGAKCHSSAAAGPRNPETTHTLHMADIKSTSCYRGPFCPMPSGAPAHTCTHQGAGCGLSAANSARNRILGTFTFTGSPKSRWLGDSLNTVKEKGLMRWICKRDVLSINCTW